jgi:hypothetical protein
MHPLFRSKFRVITLASVALMAQCCCCILPVGWQVREETPAVQALIDRVEETLQVDLSVFDTQTSLLR